MVMVIYIAIGCFVDPTSMIMISVPVFFPILVKGLGVNPIWLAVFVVIMVEVGALTPPVGLSVFTMHAVSPKASLIEITRGSLWFLSMHLLLVGLLIAFPAIVTWLPGVMWK